MSASDDTPRVDGRTARRQRNIDAVLDVVQQMFTEDSVFPTMEQVSTRSGVSLRSLYRYFDGPTALIEATVARINMHARGVGNIDDLGQGPFEERLAAFVSTRVRLHEAFGAAQQAAIFNAHEREPARRMLNANRALMRDQFLSQFELELSEFPPAAREQVVAAADVLTQLETLWYLRRHREYSLDEIAEVLSEGLRRLLR